ncbi:MAG: glycosyltransferase family 2 protein [Cryomorphaceae bacterium]
MSKVAVVIPCLNEEKYIKACVQSITSSNLTGVDLNVYVVDGISSDATRNIVTEVAASDPRVHLIDNEKRVTPVALNLGVKAAIGSDVLVILGAHAEVDKDFIQENLATLKRFPDAECVGGIIENEYENEAARIVGLAMSSPFGVGNATFRTGGKEGFVDTVAFGAYRYTVFERVGLFDERLVRNQDDEFNFRITNSGGKIYFNPKIRSKYFVRSSYAKLARQYYQYGYWKVFVNRIHQTITTWRQTIPLFFVLFLAFFSILAFFNTYFSGILFFGILAWLIGAVAAAMRQKAPTAIWPKLVLVFFILHFFYGLGYAKGILDFLIFRKLPDTHSPNITR